MTIRRIALWIGLAVGVGFWFGETARATNATRLDDPAALARAARSALDLRCASCHGADLPKPKGKFGHVTDLARLAGEPKYVVPGDAEKSELYLLMTDPDPDWRMPPDSTKTGLMSLAEIDVVRRWIDAGAPTEESAAVAEGEELADEATDSAEANADEASKAADAEGAATPDSERAPPPEALLLVSRFHPAAVHLPVGLLLVAALAELLRLATRSAALATTVRFCLALGAVGALTAAGTGWFAGEFHGYVGEDLFWHRWLGVGTAGLALVTLIVGEVARSRRNAAAANARGWNVVASCLVIGAAALVAITGHYGGTMVHGPIF